MCTGVEKEIFVACMMARRSLVTPLFFFNDILLQISTQLFFLSSDLSDEVRSPIIGSPSTMELFYISLDAICWCPLFSPKL